MASKMIDTVYQTVLALANKEQRGYITPQEFNLFARHAQDEIYEQYFYDLNQAKRRPGSETVNSDEQSNIENKLAKFIKKDSANGNGLVLPSDFYKISMVTLNDNLAESMSREEQAKYNGPLTRPFFIAPLYYIMGNFVNVKPDGEIGFSYYRKLSSPNWGYVIVGEKPLYASGRSTDFELHRSEQKNLIIKILQLAGISIKDYNIAQASAQKELSVKQQEKM
tara:strand:- start:7617 stop:8285 length:669 start_codon:yes stop_codon:yes gene_type:complete